MADDKNDVEVVGPHLELEEIHALLDQLCANFEEAPAADRLRVLIATSLGDRVAAVLNPETGKALARHWLKTSDHQIGHQCALCRDARALA